jgi:hypothetical protein
MYYKMMIVLIVVAGFNLAYGQEKVAEDLNKEPVAAEKVEQAQSKAEEKMEAGDDLKLPDKNTTEYWVLRSQTCTESIPFLTQLRSEKRGIVDLMVQFLKKTGKAQDFLKSGVKAPESPELLLKEIGDDKRYAEMGLDIPINPLDWEQAVEDAMRFVLYEGYLPTDLDGEDELEMIKQLCSQKERFCKKVRNELHETIREGLDIWFYLETIGQQEACDEFIHNQFEAEQLEKEQAQGEVKDHLTEQKLKRQEQQKQNIWQERQNRLRNRYYRGGYRTRY